MSRNSNFPLNINNKPDTSGILIVRKSENVVEYSRKKNFHNHLESNILFVCFDLWETENYSNGIY